MKPHVSKIFIYPIKSLDRVSCDRVTILQSGALQGDRAWAIFDRAGNFVNGKRNQKIHALRSEFNLETNTLSLRVQNTNRPAKFNLIEEQEKICNWLESYFGFPVAIKQDLNMGFPDDTVASGATIVSTATLEEIASWYPELDTEDIRLRFRANIEIAGVPAFWEDQLFTISGQTIKFKLGNVEFMGVNPCQRCVVITRDPRTGETYPKFQKTFINQRKATLPEWAERSRFDHFFRLAVNTKLSPPEAGKIIRVGDKVVLATD
ncbi:MOSC domain-containing protein [Pleurocapsa sp. PCC 7319]|uniref:MOSC domain-containing protein n=1 Tax=Pleurocapsa sp. PCC 7319 TaxID=118161 RepID=UPI0003475599|nr:MOSC N-terminal beta barrel domain-containing protein [Pleurocapsa sp. PCC 7319]